MNRGGAAIAADSLVSTWSGNSFRSFSGYEKIFPLLGSSGPRQPAVAAVIYGSPELLGVPWPALLSEFASSISEPTRANPKQTLETIATELFEVFLPDYGPLL